MFCKYCDQEIDVDSLYCKYCGKQVSASVPKEKSSHCTDGDRLKIPVIVNHLKKTIFIPSYKGTSTFDFQTTALLVLLKTEPDGYKIDFKRSDIIIESTGENILKFKKIEDICLADGDNLILLIKYDKRPSPDARWSI